MINYGNGGLSFTHSTSATLGSDIKSTHGPNFSTSSSQTYTTSLSSLAFQQYGSDISSSHAGNLSDSYITASDSSLNFDSATNAAAFASALGGGGTRARFDDGATIYDIEFSSYSSGTSVGIVGITQVAEGSSLSVSGLQGSGTIKIIASSGSDANAAAAAFDNALPSSRVVRFDDNQGNVIDYTFSSYSSGSGSISIASASQVSGSTVTRTSISSSSAGGSIKGVTGFSDSMAVTDSFVVGDHDGSSLGLTLGSTLVTATGAELNLLDGGTSASSVTLAGTDGFIVNDGGTMKLARISDIAAFFASGRSKKSSVLTAQVAAGGITTVSGLVHDGGADPDVVDVYLNGQMMLSGSHSANGDYRISGPNPTDNSVSLGGAALSSQTFSASTTAVSFSSALGSAASNFVAGKFVVLESSSNIRFEGIISATADSSDTSISIVSGGARVFNKVTGAEVDGSNNALTLAHSDVSSGFPKIADALTTDDIVFHFALEVDDVVTVTKNG